MKRTHAAICWGLGTLTAHWVLTSLAFMGLMAPGVFGAAASGGTLATEVGEAVHTAPGLTYRGAAGRVLWVSEVVLVVVGLAALVWPGGKAGLGGRWRVLGGGVVVWGWTALWFGNAVRQAWLGVGMAGVMEELGGPWGGRVGGLGVVLVVVSGFVGMRVWGVMGGRGGDGE